MLNSIPSFLFFSGQFELNQIKINQIDKNAYLDINELTKTFVVGIMEKLKSRLLVGLYFLHKMNFKNPSMLLTMEKDANFLNFSIYYNSCHNIKIISSHVEDKSLVEFEQLTTKHANAVTYNSYDSCKQRLNSFFN